MPGVDKTILRSFLNAGGVALALISCLAQTNAQRVVTSQYDNARTGANLAETTLGPKNINPDRFGKVFTLKVDGDVYAQPLFLGGVNIPGEGKHDVIFIATEHDTVYAFDAYGRPSAPLWKVTLLRRGETPVPADDVACPFIEPEVGITSTPVIDPETGTLYVLARTKDHQALAESSYRQSLHALAVTTGVEKFGGPVDIKAAVKGTGAGSSNGRLTFNPWRENARAALLLNQGSVYLTWASSCDVSPYHGWVLSYDAQTLKQKAVFNTSPDADDSGIWAGDTGPAADENGHVYVATGNGSFDVNPKGRDYGDSLLKLNAAGTEVVDFFTPFNAEKMDRSDNDLGSGGPLLLPTQAGRFPHEVLIAGKGGVLHLVNRDRMGRFHVESDSAVIQEIKLKGGIFGSMSYWNHFVYALGEGDALRQFRVQSGKLVPAAASANTFEGVSATPIISANGSKDGVVWVLSSKPWDGPDRAAVLFAYDATDLGRPLYSSAQNAKRDSAGGALRFNMPMVVAGHVYVGAKSEVDVYGMLPAAQRKK